MTTSPILANGNRLIDMIDRDAYYRERGQFQALERALVSLRKDGNRVLYQLVHPMFGWVSDGSRYDVVHFKALERNGLMDVISLYVFPCRHSEDLDAFIDEVSKHAPYKLKVYFKDAELYDRYVVRQPYPCNF